MRSSSVLPSYMVSSNFITPLISPNSRATAAMGTYGPCMTTRGVVDDDVLVVIVDQWGKISVEPHHLLEVDGHRTTLSRFLLVVFESYQWHLQESSGTSSSIVF
jgi:hypothetical protein